jgi:RND family efflux transporter MFP subunit
MLVLPLMLAGCSREAPEVTAGPPARPERRTETATLWSAKTELFIEFPALVEGEDSRFAIHLTRLDNFRPVAAGRAEVRLIYADGSETFSTDAPSKAGIFGVTVKPSKAGQTTVDITLKAAGLTDTHRLERVAVYPTLAAAPAGEEPATEETIAFLKEQQWAMDFATGLAQIGAVRESLTTPAEVSPRSGGEADVAAPLAGRLAGDSLPVLGTRVRQGQVLASVIPPTPAPSDRAALELAKAEAEAALAYARRDHARASRLVEAGAVPRKRLEEAATAETIAEARLRAAEERVRQFESSRAAAGEAGSPAFAIRAPIAGTVTEVHTSPGANLKGGEVLFHIVDTERVYVSAIVPEAEFPRVRNLSGAEIEIPGAARPQPAGRLVFLGQVVDASTRTFPVVYEFTNPGNRIAINQTVTIRLFFAGARRGVLIPEEALVDDGGRPVVFVQRGGEAFVRRPVEAGYRQSGMVEITSGLEAGERVVIKGAYLIRLAALSTQIPAHGHVH